MVASNELGVIGLRTLRYGRCLLYLSQKTPALLSLLKQLSKLFLFVAWLSLGLCLGFIVSGLLSWARWGVWNGPELWTLVRRVGFKLPRSSWIGVEMPIEWLLSHSVFAGASVLLIAISVWCGAISFSLARVRLELIRRLYFAEAAADAGTDSSLRSPPDATRDEPLDELRILRAYAALDHQADAAARHTDR